MTNNEEVFGFSKLLELLEETLEATNKTKQFLRACCDESQYLLKGWNVYESGEEMELPQCTCHTKVQSYDEAEEMAKEIEAALEYAQKLRKNPMLQSKKREFRKGMAGNKLSNIPSVKSAICTLPSHKNKSKDQSSTTKMPVASENHATLRKLSYPVGKRGEGELLKRMRSSSLPSSVSGKVSSTDRNSGKRKISTSYQTTYQKDFSSISNRNTCRSLQRSRELSRVEKTVASNGINAKIEEPVNKNHLKYVSGSGAISGADLDKLLKFKKSKSKIKVNLDELNVDSNIIMKSGNCELHNKPIEAMSKCMTVGLQVAVDLKGVPPELVNILKPYHTFIAEVKQSDTLFETTKSEVAEKQFVQRLTNSNQKRWKEVSCDPLLATSSELLSLFGEVSHLQAQDYESGEKVEKLQEMFEHLEKTFHRILNLDESSEPYPVSQSQHPVPLKNVKLGLVDTSWFLTGIWNHSARDMFNEMLHVQCVYYRSAEQWENFQKTLQKVQRLQLQLQVLDILHADVVPVMWNVGIDHPRFPLLYKICSALCDLALLSIPVLIRS